MKSSALLSLAIIAIFTLFSCKKNDEPSKAGYSFTLEPVSTSKLEVGEEYNFNAIDFAAHPEAALQIKMRSDTANCSSWYVYLVATDGSKYLLSGYGANGISYYVTDHFYSNTLGKINIIIKQTAGPVETYAGILLRRVPFK